MRVISTLDPDFQALVRRAKAERSQYIGELVGTALAKAWLRLAAVVGHLVRTARQGAAMSESRAR